MARKKLNKDIFKTIYKKEDVKYFECESINAIKAAFLRDGAAGSIGDRDCIGALYYMPLLNIEMQGYFS